MDSKGLKPEIVNSTSYEIRCKHTHAPSRTILTRHCDCGRVVGASVLAESGSSNSRPAEAIVRSSTPRSRSTYGASRAISAISAAKRLIRPSWGSSLARSTAARQPLEGASPRARCPLPCGDDRCGENPCIASKHKPENRGGENRGRGESRDDSRAPV